MFHFLASISRTLLRPLVYCHVGQRRHSIAVGQNKLGVVGTQHDAGPRFDYENPLRLIKINFKRLTVKA